MCYRTLSVDIAVYITRARRSHGPAEGQVFFLPADRPVKNSPASVLENSFY